MLHQTSELLETFWQLLARLVTLLDIALTNFIFEDPNMSEFKKLRTSRNHNSDNH